MNSKTQKGFSFFGLFYQILTFFFFVLFIVYIYFIFFFVITDHLGPSVMPPLSNILKQKIDDDIDGYEINLNIHSHYYDLIK